MNVRAVGVGFLGALLPFVACFGGDPPRRGDGGESFSSLTLPADATIVANFDRPSRAPDHRSGAARVGMFKVNEERARGAGSSIYPRVAPATVLVRVRGGHGTGFVVDPEGWVLTNHHVIADADIDEETGALKAIVHLGRLDDGMMRLVDEERPAIVHKIDDRCDLALLKIARARIDGKDLPSIRLASVAPKPGDECVAIGHPTSGMLWTLRGGEVAGIGQWPTDMIDVIMQRLEVKEQDREQLAKLLRASRLRKVVLSSCGLNPGDSGGPLVDAKGDLIAVSFAIPRSRPSDDQTGGVHLDKFSYHVHIDEVQSFLKDRPSKPVPYVPDAWPDGIYGVLADGDGDGVPDSLVFGDRGEGRITGVLVDLDQDSPKKSLDEIVADHSLWDFEFALRFSPRLVAFYDRDGDDKIETILTGGNDRAEKVSSTLHFKEGVWKRTRTPDAKWIDSRLYKDPKVRKRFEAIVIPLFKKLSKS
jgi:S1-C subfamily serine protease